MMNSENISSIDEDSVTEKKLNEKSGEQGMKFSSWMPETGWATSWVSTAKEKTKSTFDVIKKDIHEFSDTLQNETTSLANAVSSAAVKKAQVIQQLINPSETATVEQKEQDAQLSPSNKDEAPTPTNEEKGQESSYFGLSWVRQMANEVVETVHKFATEDTTKDEAECTEEIHIGPGGRKTILDQCTLLQMQNDHKTFLEEPQKRKKHDLYKEWMDNFKISEYNGEINLLLGNNPNLRELYSKLVPSMVDNYTFWSRYFFKIQMKELDKQLEEETALKLSLKAAGTASSVGHSPAPSNGKDDWSMCSSGMTTEAEDLEAEGQANRDDASTPRPSAKKLDEETDDWEECVGEVEARSE